MSANGELKKMILDRLALVKSRVSDLGLRREIAKIPKYEFHVHLGGSIRRRTVAELARKNGVSLPAGEREFLDAATPLEFFGGDHLWELFHDTYKWHWSCVKSCDELKRIVFEFLEDSAAQGVVHSEFTVSGSFLMNAFPFDEWVDAVGRGIDEARKSYNIRAGAILDISRRMGAANAVKNVGLVIEKGRGIVCGIGMGGDEVKYPYHLFLDAFELARKNKVPSTVHVSEFGPASLTIGVIRDLKPDRLGHALKTVESAEAYRALKESRLPVESCPLCNFVGGMGILEKMSDHPVAKYHHDGIPVGINTDNPAIFGFDLIDNYAILVEEGMLGIDDLRNINEIASRYAFKRGEV